MAECLCCPNCDSLRPSIGLEDFRSSLYLPEYYFWQQGQDRVYGPTLIPVNSGAPCENLVYDANASGGLIAGRDDIFNTIRNVDLRIKDYLGYWPRPQFSCYEWAPKRDYIGGRIRLPLAKLKAIGKETLTLLDTVPITDSNITDEDGDGLLDTITFTTPIVTGVNIDELTIFFVPEDWRKDDRYRNEIRPIRVVVDDPDWKIMFPSWMAISPKLYSGMNQPVIDPMVCANYAHQFDVYRRWADPATAITIMRRNIPCNCETSDTECYTCENLEACIINADRGVIELRANNVDGNCLCPKCIGRICINYQSGDCLDTDVIARLTAGYLGREICCSTSNPMLKFWQADFVGVDSKGKVTTTLNELERSNPFGTTLGAIDAYRFFRGRRATKAARI